MKMKRALTAIIAVVALSTSLVALAACGAPQQQSSSSSTRETLEVSESSFEPSTDPFYVLVVGNDTRTGTVEITKANYANGNARSDTMMLVRVDPVNYKLTLVSIPRDTQDVVGGSPAKINANYEVGGMTQLLDAVERLTGVAPDYYLNTTFVGFEQIIDALGGIDVYVPIDQSMQDIVGGEQVEFSAGQQHLNGAQALVFARERHKYIGMSSSEEALRQTNDRLIMQTIMQQILANSQAASALTHAVYGFVDTNFSEDELVGYIEDFAAHADQVTYLSGTGPFDGGVNDEVGLWLAYRDEDTWRQIIAQVNAGGDPNTIVQAPSF